MSLSQCGHLGRISVSSLRCNFRIRGSPHGGLRSIAVILTQSRPPSANGQNRSFDRLIYLNKVAASVVEDGVFDPSTFRWLL